MTASITVSTKLLAAVAKWAIASDEVRPHLHMVLFTTSEIVACDGHRLVRVPREAGNIKPFGIDRAHILAACAAQHELGREYRDIAVTHDGDKVASLILDPHRMPRSRITITVPSRDAAQFPPYEQVMPKRGDGPVPESYFLNPKYLAAIAEVNEASAPSSARGVQIVAWGGELDPMLFENHCRIQFVVMPMRCT